ncbi:hypothetical protein [Vibrio cholerae]|uniref:hypothetical protein n=1 Tax=Vibrio cholerae TaxID=666 RepID=UPI00084DD188|nr:hypothetical protein [Vibrio cholerae]EGQ9396154.1 hypothetical protein [Vibrio cholerae]EGR3963882.1 hypothetical protein [Vibrio cholerae]EKF9266475.1 hypothetical protein [Vibrio cholerae]EKO4195399.1 hypothetical protein [Vibrio cholerae]MCR9698139.1 hypothetical protein [Vibrio cholerae]
MVSEELVVWLKDTIPGIIVLGAFGSILGAFLLWAIAKITLKLWSFAKRKIDKQVLNVMLRYMKGYLVARATILQLQNKNSTASIIALYSRVLTDKQTSSILSFLLFISLTIFLSVTGTEYLKTSVFLVSMFFMFLHDAIVYRVLQLLFDTYLFGNEEKFAKATYDDNIVSFIELIISLRPYIDKFNNIDFEAIARK